MAIVILNGRESSPDCLHIICHETAKIISHGSSWLIVATREVIAAVIGAEIIFRYYPLTTVNIPCF